MNNQQTIRISGIVKQSAVDGPGLRLTVFTQGCPHRCPGCQNPETNDFEGGQDIPATDILNELDKNPLLQGITLSGGEPLARPQQLLPITQGAKARGKDIVCFTGYTLEELLPKTREDKDLNNLLTQIDLLIDGRYDATQRDLTLRFRGSRNQRVLNLPASLAKGEAVLAEGYGQDF